MKKKFLSILLVLAMCLNMLPTAALAALPQPDTSGNSVAEVTKIDTSGSNNIQVTEYVEENELPAKLTDPNTVKIKLLKDAVISQSAISDLNTNCYVDDKFYDCVQIPIDSDMTLELNGHKLNIDGLVNIAGELTVLDSGKGGVLAPQCLLITYTIDKGALTLAGGTIASDVLVDGGIMNVFGGKVAGTVSIRHYTSDGYYLGGRLEVTGGEIDALKIQALVKQSPYDSSEEVLLSGGHFGSIVYDISAQPGYMYSDYSLFLTLKQGSAFYDKNDNLLNADNVWELKDTHVGSHECTFTNGDCACGNYKYDRVSGNPDTAVAKVEYYNGTKYVDDITNAFNYDGTITLLQDCSSSATHILSDNSTLDLNGKTLTISHYQGIAIEFGGSLTVTDTSTEKNGKFLLGALEIEKLSSLTLENGTIQVDKAAFKEENRDAICTVSGALTVNGGTLLFGEDTKIIVDGAMTVNGGTVEVKRDNLSKINSIYLKSNHVSPYSLMSLSTEQEQDTTPAQNAGDTMRINGGTIKAQINVCQGKTLTITGGTFPAATNYQHSDGVLISGGTATITGGTMPLLSVREDLGSKVEVSGGTFTKVQSYNTDTPSVRKLLKNGYGFADKNDTTKIVSDSYDSSGYFDSSYIENVTVVAHTHTFNFANYYYICACGEMARNLPVSYIDAYGAEQNCTEYTEITSVTTSWDSGWYVVKKDTSINGDVHIGDNAHLILCNGATLVVNGKITGYYDNSLTVYAQSANANQYGKMNVSGYFGTNDLISLTVNGGEVNVDGGSAENSLYVKNLTVNAGRLIAKNDEISTISYNLPISAIYVTEKLTVNDGEIQATGPSIGTEPQPYNFTNEYLCAAITVGQNMIVNGGTVTATGGTIYADDNNVGINACISLPIGPNQGNRTPNPKLTVNQGTVTAKGGAISSTNGEVISADIYSQNTGGDMTVSGGKVQSAADGSAVKVMFDGLYAYGGTIKLALGSELGSINTKSVASFGDLLADGCSYFKYVPSTKISTQLNNNDITYIKYQGVYYLSEFGKSILIRKPESNENPPITYIDENGEQKNCVLYTLLNSTDGDYTINKSGWYVARPLNDNPTITGTLNIANDTDVHLIICDNTMLTVNGGINSEDNANLHIYSQRAESDEDHDVGKLVATSAATGDNVCGICVNSLTINGGVIEASAPNALKGYGICVNGDLTINGGTVTATAGKTTVADNETTGNDYCGIYVLNNITVTGGTVTAIGGTIQTASSNTSWHVSKGIKVWQGNITVTGGTVTATGGAVRITGTTGSSVYNYGYSHGIYFSDSSSKCKLTVNGGKVTATGSDVSVTNGDVAGGFSYGVYISGDVEVKNNTLTSTGGNVTVSGTSQYLIRGRSYGLYIAPILITSNKVINGSLQVAGGTLNTTSGNVTVTRTDESCSSNDDSDSTALYLSGAMTVSDGTVNTTHGTATLAENSNGDTYTEDLYIYELTVNGGTMKLKESSLGNPVTASNGVSLANLLTEGYAYWQEEFDEYWEEPISSGFIALADLTTSLNGNYKNYFIKPCTHSNSYGTCAYCDQDLGSASTGGGGGGSYKPGYTITPKDTLNGDVTVSPQSASKGDTVTITATPDKGYNLETLTVIDKDGNEIQLTNNGDGTYTFKMPASKVDITATFTEDNSILNFFIDVLPDNYYYNAVLWAAKNDITGGIDENHFVPDQSCTRAQLVTFLWRVAGCPVVNYAMSFTDVGDTYYTEAIRWAASLGIVNGYSDSLFGTDDSITREQMVTILYRFAQAMNMDTTQGGMAVREFADYASISAYAIEAMQWAVNAGILQGDNNNLLPVQPCTRAQIVTMLYRLLGA